MYEQSHRDYLRSGYLHHRLLSNRYCHCRDNADTSQAQRDKMPENCELANAAITDMQMHVSVMLLRSMQNTKELAEIAKAENDALRDDVAAGRRPVAHQSESVWSVREATTASSVDNTASPTGRHR